MVMFQAKFVFFFPQAQLCFGFFKGIEPNSKCTGAHMYCETLSFSTGVVTTFRVRTELLLTEKRLPSESLRISSGNQTVLGKGGGTCVFSFF